MDDAPAAPWRSKLLTLAPPTSAVRPPPTPPTLTPYPCSCRLLMPNLRGGGSFEDEMMCSRHVYVGVLTCSPLKKLFVFRGAAVGWPIALSRSFFFSLSALRGYWV